MRIRAEKINKTFQDANKKLVILDDVSIEFESAETVAILGRSGIGKSTFLQIVGGLDRPSSGSVFYDQNDISKLNTDQLAEFRGLNVGFIFQFHNLLPEFTALENVAMPLIIAGVSEDQASKEAAEFLYRVGLAERKTHRPSELSGGEQQRVAIARAIAGSPKVILADEPTGNLDFSTANEVQGMLIEITKSISASFIVVTHNTDLAQNMSKTYEMQPGGKLVPVGN